MSRHVRVLHVFDAACNLINENDQVISLVSSQIGDGPFNVVVPGVNFSDYVTPADPVTRTPGNLMVGHLTVNILSARQWSPRPCWESLHADPTRLFGHLTLLLDVLRDQAPVGSLAGLLFAPTGPISAIDTAVLHTAREPAAKLVTGLSQDDHALCLEGAASLSGLGGGLTPAGDDWLVGFMLGIWAASARHTIPPTAIAQTAAPRTTPLSAAWLHAAARGECGAPWHILFESLIKGSEPAITQAAEAVIHQGHTSGADALAGFCNAF